MKSDAERSWAANRGYDDSAGIYYSYDSNVGNSRRVSPGDLIVVREDEYVAGWGFVEFIDVIEGTIKEITRCPRCRRTNFSRRKTVSPANKCGNCRQEFHDHEALVTQETVTAFRAYYANTWTEAVRPVHYKELEPFIKTRDTFNAIRPLDTTQIRTLIDSISAREVEIEAEVQSEIVQSILGGHTEAIVRRRRGQRTFRFQMMKRFGEICAFSGHQPPQVLEAAHLYSFAERGEHVHDGGLLLRRDFHALFDAHLITVNPSSWSIEIAPLLQNYETYSPLAQQELKVSPDRRPSVNLIATHYEISRDVFRGN